MSKMMFVTMGTSLFHSASWDPDRPPATRLCREYRSEWTHREGLASPERRLTSLSSALIRNDLREHLKDGEPASWAAALPEDFLAGRPDSTAFLRYSAELATILTLSEARDSGTTLVEFLRSYKAIHLVYDSNTSSKRSALPALAASHLRAYLEKLTGWGPVHPCPIPGLSSTDAAELLESETSGLPALGVEIVQAASGGHEIDCVVSGGYKLYGIYLSQFALRKGSGVRLLYLHEEGAGVLPVQVGEGMGKPAGGREQAEIVRQAARESERSMVGHF